MKGILFLLVLIFSSLGFSQDIVRFVQSNKHPDSKDKYFVDLLTMTLERTVADFGEYKLQPVAIEMAQERTSKMLERNEYIDLTWRMTSASLEKSLQAVYFPLLKGMMGYRIFIIRQDSQALFHKNMSLTDLQNITVGQGYNWPDSEILEKNGFKLTKGYDVYLLKMLENNRFDFFPRALHEPWLEILGNSNFIVERHILIKYHAPIFFFVNKNNSRLSKRISTGLNKLLESGEFDNYFKNNPLFSNVIEKSNLSQRKVFELYNPLISKKTQALIDNKNLWLNLLAPSK